MKWISNINIPFLIIVIVVVCLTNYLTKTHYEGLSKKEIKAIHRKMDSLQSRYLEESIIQLANAQKLEKIHEEDSVFILRLNQQIAIDNELAKLQNQTMKKFEHLTGHQLLQKLDSAYGKEFGNSND